MSELVWGTNPQLPENAAEVSEPQAIVTQPQAPAPQPLTRRELRAQREAAAASVSRTVASTPAQAPAAPAEAAPVEAAAETLSIEDILSPLTITPIEVSMRPRKAKRVPKGKRNLARPASRPKQRAATPGAAASRSAASVWPALATKSVAKKKPSARAVLAKLMSFGAMVGVAAMLVATSVPANAFFGETEQLAAAKAPAAEVQNLNVQESPAVAAKPATRDAYTVVSIADQLRKKYGNQTFEFTNNPNGTIQWPFATSVPISSGFGHRNACSFCSTQHMGLDFAPGAGVPIQSIADGVVSDVIVDSGGLGVHIIVDHVINGQNIQSWYAHMKWGSPVVAPGQKVTVGQQLGAVGSTGASTGAHLHLEVHVEGTPVDPFAWLKANAN